MNARTDKRMGKEKRKILLLYLLKILNNTAEKYDIPIYASGGTCLGMLRHKGMIPWDDDIDIMIFRKDYNRLVSALSKEIHTPVAIRTRENDPYFYQEFMKLCYLDDGGEFSDLSIDIFTLDNTDPERKTFRAVQNTVKRLLYYAKMYKVSKLGHGEYHPKSLVNHLCLFVVSLLPLSWMDYLLKKTLTADKREGEYVVNWGAAYSYKRATYPRAAFGVPRKMPFENTYVWAEQHPEAILERLYGKKYMELPPLEKRTEHGVRDFSCRALNIDEIRKEVGL